MIVLRSGPCVALVAALCCSVTSVASPAFAHGGAVPLTFWGGFPSATARCQRVIGHAAALCPSRAIRARVDCRLEVLGGGTCDVASVNAQVQAARAHGRSLIRERCTAVQVQTLNYIDVNEALTDFINICRDMDNRVMARSFAPADAASDGFASDVEAMACIAAASTIGPRLLAFAIDAHRKALDRISTKRLGLPRKEQLIARSRARIADATQAAARVAVAHCSPVRFTALYGLPPLAYFTDLMTEAECYGGAVYVQDEIVCPTPAQLFAPSSG